MLYGTCCQLLGDSETFGRIYRDLAPEMELRVTHGERSELVSMWLKYAAMFAVVFSLVCSASAANEGNSLAVIGCPTNGASAVVAENNSNLYDSVLKMPLRDQFRFFLNRSEVRQMLQGEMRAVIIPLQKTSKNVDNLLLMRVSSSLKTGSEVIRAISRVESLWDPIFIEREYGEFSTVFVRFSPFEQIVNSKSAEYEVGDMEEQIQKLEKSIHSLEQEDRVAQEWGDSRHSFYIRSRKLKSWRKELEFRRKKLECLRKGGMIPYRCDSREIYTYGAMLKVLQILKDRGGIADLIVSSEELGSYVLGVCFLNIYGSGVHSKYAGPRDYRDRLPKYVKTPDGTVLYELTEEDVRRESNRRHPRHTNYGGLFHFDDDIDYDF